MSFFDSSSWKGSRPSIGLPKCGQCGLYKLCKSPKMKPTGTGDRKILFVGEAPGATEDEEGVQFVGDSGRVLRKMLQEIDYDLDDGWITNAAICRPEGNEIEDLHIESCRPNLLRTIQDLKPNVIVLLGASAVQSLIGTEWKQDIGSISRWVGWTIPSQTYGAWICPTYHPSYLLRMREDPALKVVMKQHLQKAISLEGVPPSTEPLASLQSDVEVILDPKVGVERMRALALQLSAKDRLAFDFETTGLKPERPEQRIYSCSFCLNGRETFACPITPDSYLILSQILLSPARKIASNLKFEERWTRQKLGHGAANWWHDTMLSTHLLDNRGGICSIKFQSYVRYGIADYSSSIKYYLEATTPNGLNNIEKAPLKDLLLYNGMDSLLEYRVAMMQRREMGQ